MYSFIIPTRINQLYCASKRIDNVSEALKMPPSSAVRSCYISIAEPIKDNTLITSNVKVVRYHMCDQECVNSSR